MQATEYLTGLFGTAAAAVVEVTTPAVVTRATIETAPAPAPSADFSTWVLRRTADGRPGWESPDAPECRYPTQIPYFPPARGLCGPYPENRRATIAPDGSQPPVWPTGL